MKRKIILWLMAIAVVFSILYNRHEHKEANLVTVYSAFLDADMNPDNYLHTIDLYRTVKMIKVSQGDTFIQYQIPNAPQGNFYALEGSTPSGLGISEHVYVRKWDMLIKKEKRVYISLTDFEMLSSYAAPVVDDWSTPEIETQTKGRELQFFTTCKKCFERVK